MALFEKILTPVTGEDGGDLEIMTHWIRWSSDSPSSRGTRMPTDLVPGLVKAISQNCDVRKVRVEGGIYTPVNEDVRDYAPPGPHVPMSEEEKFFWGIAGLVTVVSGGVYLLTRSEKKKKNKKVDETMTVDEIDEKMADMEETLGVKFGEQEEQVSDDDEDETVTEVADLSDGVEA